MVSTPGEIYSYGTIFIYLAVLYPFGIVIASKLYLPVFEQMGMVSIYKVNTGMLGMVVFVYSHLCILLCIILKFHGIHWNAQSMIAVQLLTGYI